MGAELLIALSGPFREAMKAELTPENFPFTNPQIWFAGSIANRGRCAVASTAAAMKSHNLPPVPARARPRSRL